MYIYMYVHKAIMKKTYVYLNNELQNHLINDEWSGLTYVYISGVKVYYYT